MITRRGFLRGLSVAVAAPAIVRAASLMPVSASRRLTLGGVEIFFDGEGPLNNWWIPHGLYDGYNLTRDNALCAMRTITNDKPPFLLIGPKYAELWTKTDGSFAQTT